VVLPAARGAAARGAPARAIPRAGWHDCPLSSARPASPRSPSRCSSGGLRGASSAPQAPSTQSSGPANDTASTTAGIACAAVIESLAGFAHAIAGALPREINEVAIRGRIAEQP
jgi:hypothetical protein